MVVSFKLETDEALLLDKAAAAVDAYGVHLVVANLLHTRKDRVYLVSKQTPPSESGGAKEEAMVHQVDRPEGEPVIERVLVLEVVARHQKHAASSKEDKRRS